MKRSTMKLVALFVAVAAMFAGTAAFAAEWAKLGERVVNDRVDRDTIMVTALKGQFSALQLRVHKRPVRILDMKVNFANGATQDVSLRAVIPAGGKSRVIDLRGDDRVIRSVDFTYEAQSIGRGKKAAISLWGRR
ncbi:MAG: hypothetical protein ACOY3Y_19360 [Acidobacteriota bacterium]